MHEDRELCEELCAGDTQESRAVLQIHKDRDLCIVDTRGSRSPCCSDTRMESPALDIHEDRIESSVQ